MSILDIKEVSKQYHQHTALDKISIQVQEGSIFGLLGPNGAGKTTLIRILNQIIAPDEGVVLYDGKKLNAEVISQIGYLPEERGLYKKVKVLEQLVYLGQLKGMDKYAAFQKSIEWLKKLDIDKWKDKRIEDLSKGMQQKIQFIATVIHQPRLVILDEPFSGFDPINAEIIKNEILNIKKQGGTIILSTHNMNSVEELCDDIALIHRSKVVLQGNVHAIKKQFKSSIYHIQFKGNLQAVTHAIWASAELLDSKIHQDEASIRIKLKPAVRLNQVLQQILPVCDIISVQEEMLSMHDIFIKTVSENNYQDILKTTSTTLTE